MGRGKWVNEGRGLSVIADGGVATAGCSYESLEADCLKDRPCPICASANPLVSERIRVARSHGAGERVLFRRWRR